MSILKQQIVPIKWITDADAVGGYINISDGVANWSTWRSSRLDIAYTF